MSQPGVETLGDDKETGAVVFPGIPVTQQGHYPTVTLGCLPCLTSIRSLVTSLWLGNVLMKVKSCKVLPALTSTLCLLFCAVLPSWVLDVNSSPASPWRRRLSHFASLLLIIPNGLQCSWGSDHPTFALANAVERTFYLKHFL